MTDIPKEKNRYEQFCVDAKKDMDEYKNRLRGDGTFEYVNQVVELEKLSHKINSSMLVYLFGNELGEHLAKKFAYDCNRNLLSFLSGLTKEYRFYILHELKNNPYIFAYC
jgi:hypothetical protein